MKLSKLLSISVLSISTLLTGCKPANSEDTLGDGIRIDFITARLRVVIKSPNEGTKYISLDNKDDISASSIGTTYLQVGVQLYTEALLDNQIYKYSNVDVTDTTGKSSGSIHIQLDGYYKFTFTYSILKLEVKPVSQS